MPRGHVPFERKLVERGREVLEQLFPGFGKEMVGQGAMSGDVVDDAPSSSCPTATAA
jgi:hypothetical protein